MMQLSLLAQVVVFSGATIYTIPEKPPIRDGLVVVSGSKIASVGSRARVKAPAGAELIDCTGLVIAAGFQNSHVHFTESKWEKASEQPAAKLERQLVEMLTSYGFTTVVDTASNTRDTVYLKTRILSGYLKGPRILTAGYALFPPGPLPFYLKGALTDQELERQLQPTTPYSAATETRWNIANGADVTKLFVGSLETPTKVNVMALDLARAAAQESHKHRVLVMAHPSNVPAIRVSLQAGVDVLVHTAPGGGEWDSALLRGMVRRKMALIPTLKLWGYEMRKAKLPESAAEGMTRGGMQQLRRFVRTGGQVLFGTDAGYMTEYDPTDEYVLMKEAGMTPAQILASLTTAPAARFGESKRRGVVARGFDADLVVLAGDPMQDVRNFARVRYTVRQGEIIYRSE